MIEWGMRRMTVMFTTYALGGIMDSLTGSLRGFGYSALATFSTICGVCGIRLIWVCLIFPLHRSFEMLFLSYPISWTAVAACSAICLHWIWKKKFMPLKRQRADE